MIKYAIYSIKDVVTGNFSDIQCFVNRDQAIRYFKGLCAESKIKTDLQLFELGEYDIQTGEIVSKVEFIIGGADCE